MCGIIGCVVISKGRSLGVVRKIYKIYKNQKLRGIDGTGVSIFRNGVLKRVRDVEPDILFSVMYYKFWKKVKNGDIILVHHRIPTSGGGGDSLRSNHPISNEDNTLHLIHNGYITNVDFLYNKLIQMGHKFETNISEKKGIYNITDSEVLVHILEEKDDIKEAVKLLDSVVDGHVAIGFVKKGENKIWLYRNGWNPIETFKDEVGNLFFASEMPEKEGFKKLKKIDENVLYSLDKDDGLVRYRKFKQIKGKKKKGIKKSNNTENWYGFDENGEWLGGDTKW